MGMAGKPVEMVFEFDSVRNFSSIILHTNNMFSKDVQVIYINLIIKTQLTEYAPQMSAVTAFYVTLCEAKGLADDERGEIWIKVPSQSIHYGALVCIEKKKYAITCVWQVRKSHAPRLKQKKPQNAKLSGNILFNFESGPCAVGVRVFSTVHDAPPTFHWATAAAPNAVRFLCFFLFLVPDIVDVIREAFAFI